MDIDQTIITPGSAQQKAPPAAVPPTPKKSYSYSKKFPLLFLVIVIVAFGVVLALAAHYRTKTPTTTTTTTKTPSASKSSITQSADVAIASGSFSPATLQTKPNTEVNWTNNDSSPHEIAADPYPKDDSITGFNSHVVLQKGDSYSFTFTKAGTYTYHDELNPLKLKGTIVVK